jgi:hypothetical protein
MPMNAATGPAGSICLPSAAEVINIGPQTKLDALFATVV